MIPVYLSGRQILSSLTVDRNELQHNICKATNLQPEEFYLQQNGKILSSELIYNASAIHVQLRTLGGKGGFGSMLRAIGAQIEKTTNREACRDLSGRRLRDINEEKRLKAWLEKQKDREAEAEEKKKKRVEKLLHVPKHEFKDDKYEEARSKLTEKVNDSVEEGFKKAVEQESDKPSLKRKTAAYSQVKRKKAALWIGADIDGSTSSDSDDSDDDKPSTSKREDNKSGESILTSNKNDSDAEEIEDTKNKN